VQLKNQSAQGGLEFFYNQFSRKSPKEKSSNPSIRDE